MKNLWVPISGAIAQQRNVETIANNIANVNTPGFKKDKIIFKEYLTSHEKGIQDIDLPNKEWSPADFYRSYGEESAQVKIDGSYTNHEQGQLVPTKNPFDLAINGPGLFEVLTPGGIKFTRRGTFTLSATGNLVNNRGDFLLFGSTDPNATADSRKISLKQLPTSVNNKGEIFQDNKVLGKISLTEFKDLNALRREGNSYFVNSIKDNTISSGNKSFILQGFIEQSNVNAVSEISELIKAHRHFESIQKVIKAYDQMSGRGVNEIAKF